MKRIVSLISGRGSNLKALLEIYHAENWHKRYGCQITGVISNRTDAGGLDIAKQYGIPTSVVLMPSKSAMPDRAQAAVEFDEQLKAAVEPEGNKADLVILAGFMKVLSAAWVGHFADRLMNIHPSLLPSYAGLNTHERVLARGGRIHGATVHWVIPEVDAGPIIAQAAVRVLADDSAESLAARVLTAEHQLLPQCVRWWLEDRLHLDASGRVIVDGIHPSELLLWQE